MEELKDFFLKLLRQDRITMDEYNFIKDKLSNEIPGKIDKVLANIYFRLRGFFLDEMRTESLAKEVFVYWKKYEPLEIILQCLNKVVGDDHNPFDPAKDDFAAIVSDFRDDTFKKCECCEKYIRRTEIDGDYCEDCINDQ
jgi:hypothetical protein